MSSEMLQHPLSGLRLVEAMEPGHVEMLNSLARETAFEKDEIIFTEGGRHNRFYVLLSGKVALEVRARDRVFRVQTVQEGGELGWSSLLADERKHFQARALEPVRALAFEGEELQKACRTDPSFGFALVSRVLRVVSSRLEATRLRLLDIYAARD